MAKPFNLPVPRNANFSTLALLLSVIITAAPTFAMQPPQASETVQAIAERIEAGDYDGVQGVILGLDGEVMAEAYAPRNGPDRRHDIRSATKSITALLIGILLEEGQLKSVSTPLSNLLPETFASLDADDPRRQITVEDALTMRTGLACDDWAPASVGQEDKMYKTQDWAAFLLALPISHEIGAHFSYCTGGVILLGRVIEQLGGQPVPAFAQQHLFDPLGIRDAEWAETPGGHTDTGGHLELRLQDLYRIGQLVAQDGEWNGQQIVSRRWVRTITSEQTPVPGRRERYGYLWWLNEGTVAGQAVSLVYAHGNGGNFIFIVPELGLVAAFNANNYNSREQFIPMQILSEEMIPALLTSEE